jgi:hypothetical protein
VVTQKLQGLTRDSGYVSQLPGIDGWLNPPPSGGGFLFDSPLLGLNRDSTVFSYNGFADKKTRNVAYRSGVDVFARHPAETQPFLP